VVINRQVVEGRGKPKIKYHKADKAGKAPKQKKALKAAAPKAEDNNPADAA